MAAEHDPVWWATWLIPLPFIGVWMKVHYAHMKDIKDKHDAQDNRIKDAHEAAATALRNAALLKEDLASCRLGVEKDFASNVYIQQVEARLTKRFETMERRILNILSEHRA